MKYISLSGIIGGELNKLFTQLFAAIGINTISSTSSISSFPGNNFDTLYVSDPIRGGEFIKYVGSDTADNGMIFLDASSNKWKRVISDERLINVQWYGASAAASAATNYAAFQAAFTYYSTHRTEIDIYKIPSGLYLLSETLVFNCGIIIEGSRSALWEPTTILQAPQNTRVLYFQPQDTDVFSCSVKDLAVENQNEDLARDEDVPSIDTRCRVIFENVHVRWASGPCLNIEAYLFETPATNEFYGDCSSSYFRNCRFVQGLHGIRIRRSDCNTMTFIACDIRANVRWGVDSEASLGNNFISCKWDGNSNADVDGALTTVNYGGNYYSATFLHDDGSGIGKQPDIEPTYWLPTHAQASTAWDSGTHYYSGGWFGERGASATNWIIAPYVEDDQAQAQVSAKTTILGGTGAPDTGVSGGILQYATEGVMHIKNFLRVHGGLALGLMEYPNYSLHISDATNRQAHIKSTGTQAAIAFENNSSSADLAYIAYLGTDLLLGAAGVTRATLNASGLYVNGNTLRVGTAKTPASAGAAGTAGEICWDSSYVYICIATNTWRRIAHNTW